jgi:hypothetical protein
MSYTAMMKALEIAMALAALAPSTRAFVIPRSHDTATVQTTITTARTTTSTASALFANVGIFFGTSTGSTEEVADLIKEEFGDDADGPIDVERLEGSVKSNFEKYDALVVGSESLVFFGLPIGSSNDGVVIG